MFRARSIGLVGLLAALTVLAGLFPLSLGISGGAAAAPSGPAAPAGFASGSGGPSPRVDAGVVYDAADRYTLVFGGCAAAPFTNCTLNDTWVHDASGWRQLHPAVHPSGRGYPLVVYDPAMREVVLFSGYNGLVEFNDTWTFHAGVWTNITRGFAPPVGFGIDRLVWDASDGYVLFFGGSSSRTTYEFDNGTWSVLVIHHGHTPPALYGPDLAYDPLIGRVLLFGGWVISTGRLTNMTWSYHNGTWRVVPPVAGYPAPPARWRGAMAYDPALKEVVLFGGIDLSYTAFSDTWAFAGGHWSRLNGSTTPPGGSNGGLIYNRGAGALQLYAPTRTGLRIWKLGPTGWS